MALMGILVLFVGRPWDLEGARLGARKIPRPWRFFSGLALGKKLGKAGRKTGGKWEVGAEQ